MLVTALFLWAHNLCWFMLHMELTELARHKLFINAHTKTKMAGYATGYLAGYAT